jgi:hypothetical protein
MSGSEGSLNVTPGYGTPVATKVIDGRSHQWVITAPDSFSGKITPAALAQSYDQGDVIGDVNTLNDLNRYNGAISRLNNIQIDIVDITAITPSLQVIIFDSIPAGDVTDGVALTLSAVDARKVQAVIDVEPSDFKTVAGVLSKAVVDCSGIIIKSGSTTKNVFAVVVSKHAGTISFSTTESLSLTVNSERQ